MSSRTVSALLAVACIAGASAPQAGSPPQADLIETGRLIYQEGRLPGGRPLQGSRPDGLRLQGETAACITCHRRSGMGSVEGNLESTILAPPVAGRLLMAPTRFAGTYVDSSHYYIPNDAWERAISRPAYDSASFARLMREGIDPGGKPVGAPMMRYQLDDRELAALQAYLHTLVPDAPPGVEPNVLHLATVITPDVAADQIDTVLGILKAWAAGSRIGGRSWKLHTWELQGPASDWNAQLQEFYRQQPVFALLSGVGANDWQPVHAFCEQYAVPCVLPVVDSLDVSEHGVYSMYYSPGVRLEADILARTLIDNAHRQPGKGRLIQITADASGLSAAEVLDRRLSAAGMAIETRRFRWTSPATAVAGVHEDDTLVLWLRPEQIAQLDELLEQKPAQLYLSALLSAPGVTPLSPGFRDRAVWVSLFDDLGVQGEIAGARLSRWLKQRGLSDDPQQRRQQADAYAAGYLFRTALREILKEEHRRPAVPLNREHVLETLEMLVSKYDDGTDQVNPDSHVAMYGRMSLGPDQRIAVRGGRLVRYRTGEGTGESARLEFISDRIAPDRRLP